MSDERTHYQLSRASLKYGKALLAIMRTLDGQIWTADTCDAIARIPRDAGFTIREPKG